MLFVLVQDTCTGFLLGGVGERNKLRQPNFLVVEKSEYYMMFMKIKFTHSSGI